MADEFGHHATTGNWWDSSPRTVSSSSAAAVNGMGRFGWPADMEDIKSRSSMDSVSVSGSSVVGYHEAAQKLQGSDSVANGGVDGGGLVDPNLHMMGLGLSSQAMDWNQALLRGEKSDGSFRSMLEENGSFQHETGQWRDKVFGGGSGSEDFKQINRGFSLDQPQFSSHGSSVDSTGSFHADGSGVYGAPSTLLRGLLGPDQHQHHQINQQQPQSLGSRMMNTNSTYQYNPPNYGMNSNTNDLLPPTWSKVPQFLRTSPPKQPPHSPLQFSNNAPFWNASADVRSSFFPSLQTQLPTQSFDDHKPTKINMSEARGETGSGGSVVANKSSETASKRPRKESPSPLPAFKVRKEKMGDRITALQQLVSPFGKTDTASVLSEAIEYIKFLHEQVNVLSTPYMKSGAPIQHQQGSAKSSKDPEGQTQDLRSRGLCLVPVSSTFPVAHETTVDFWTPTFGGTFR